MHHRRQFAIPTILIAAVGCVNAADLTVSDLRLGAGILSNEFKGSSSTTVTQNSGVSTNNVSDNEGRNSDQNWRGQLQYMHGRLGDGGGLIWGVGVAVNHATWDNGPQDAHVTTPTVDLLLGYGYAVTSSWHVELTPFAGYGRAYYSVTDQGSTHTNEDWEDYVEYGAKIGTYYALDHFVIGVEVPYLVGRFDPEYSYNDSVNRQVTVKDERRNEGFGVLVSVASRF